MRKKLKITDEIRQQVTSENARTGGVSTFKKYGPDFYKNIGAKGNKSQGKKSKK